MSKKSEQETSVLFELINHRYETGSLLITANQAFSDRENIFPDIPNKLQNAMFSVIRNYH